MDILNIFVKILVLFRLTHKVRNGFWSRYFKLRLVSFIFLGRIISFFEESEIVLVFVALMFLNVLLSFGR